ncbi:MAG: hypothetical protein HKN44_08995 [Ilumatobacter sp.]|nr:hypothetical protein [Ilumatobacter sp.]
MTPNFEPMFRLAVTGLFMFSVVAGAVVFAADATAVNAFRWIMAMLFIGTPMLFLWSRSR